VPASSAPQVEPDQEFGEPRWPIGLAILAYVAITLVLRLAQPRTVSLGPHWLVAGIEIGLFLALIAANPARISRRHRWLRRVAVILIILLVLVALAYTGKLVSDLIHGSKVTESADSLLASGALIWVGNCLVFSLLYWELDSGGPRARFLHEHEYPDFAFTQQQNPELAPPNWRPRYLDYLVLGLTTNTAFSPTDVLPMARWAKLTMALQSLISLLVVAFVIARAVNVFK